MNTLLHRRFSRSHPCLPSPTWLLRITLAAGLGEIKWVPVTFVGNQDDELAQAQGAVCRGEWGGAEAQEGQEEPFETFSLTLKC